MALAYDNLGYLHAQRGDVPRALSYMSEAERQHRALGIPAGTILMDKAELLLSVRLNAEARETAGRAVAEFTDRRRMTALPQALLLVADASLLAGDPTGARHAAQEALQHFRRQHRADWAARAHYTLLRARLADR